MKLSLVKNKTLWIGRGAQESTVMFWTPEWFFWKCANIVMEIYIFIFCFVLFFWSSRFRNGFKLILWLETWNIDRLYIPVNFFFSGLVLNWFWNKNAVSQVGDGERLNSHGCFCFQWYWWVGGMVGWRFIHKRLFLLGRGMQCTQCIDYRLLLSL